MSEAPKFGLPIRPFLYTLDQLSVILDIPIKSLNQNIYFEGRSIGVRSRALMVARNIASDDSSPDWRVAERELIRWMRLKGFKYYERGWIQS